MSEHDPSAGLESLVARLAAEHPDAEAAATTPPPPSGADALVHELVYAMLLWDASAALARAALARLQEGFADYNELRVAFPDETAALMPDDMPARGERAERLRAALNHVFRRESGLTLARLADGGKREARAALASLEGVPPFAAARVILFALGGHAVPADARIVRLLAEHGVLEPGTEPADAAGKLERLVKAQDAKRVYALLEAAASAAGPEPAASKPARKPAAKSSRSRTAATKKTGRSRKTA